MTLASLCQLLGMQAVASVFLAAPAQRPHPVLCALTRGMVVYAVTTGNLFLAALEAGCSVLTETWHCETWWLLAARQVAWWTMWQGGLAR